MRDSTPEGDQGVREAYWATQSRTNSTFPSRCIVVRNAKGVRCAAAQKRSKSDRGGLVRDWVHGRAQNSNATSIQRLGLVKRVAVPSLPLRRPSALRLCAPSDTRERWKSGVASGLVRD